MHKSFKLVVGIPLLWLTFHQSISAQGTGPSEYVQHYYGGHNAPGTYKSFEDAFKSRLSANGQWFFYDPINASVYSDSVQLESGSRYTKDVTTVPVQVPSFEDLPANAYANIETRTVRYTVTTWWGEKQEGSFDFSVGVSKCPRGRQAKLTTVYTGVPETPTNLSASACEDVVPDNKINKKPPQCGYGNPIFPVSGTKRQPIDLGLTISGVPLALTYDSSRALAPYEYFDAPGFGRFWLSSLHRSLFVTSAAVLAYRGDGSVITFKKVGGQFITDSDINERLLLDAGTGGFWLRNPSEGTLERYDSAGALQSLHSTDGRYVVFTYSDASTPSNVAPAPGYLIKATDQGGRITLFRYTIPAGADATKSGRVTAIQNANGETYAFAYDGNGNLSALTWPDGAVRRMVYESPNLLWALTGVLDENSNRYSTFQYDASGFAVSTEHAGGVNRYAVSYAYKPSIIKTFSVDAATQAVSVERSWSAPVGTVVISPNGNQISLQSQVINGASYVSSASQPAGSGCAATNRLSVFDSIGNVTSKIDFSGNKVCSVYDTSNREIERVEGLSATADCAAVTGSGGVLPVNARKMTRQWHPSWNLTSLETVQGVSRTYRVYNGQPDPFNGSALANCSSALLPDGTPLPLLCRSVRQALTSAGAIDVSTPSASSSFTYDAAGRVLTSTDPKGASETYTYHAATSFSGVDPSMVGQSIGDLATFTNATGLTTTYTTYDKMGRLKQMTDPKGVVTDINYTPRGLVGAVSMTAPGLPARTTTNSYDAVGQKVGVTAPDGTSTTYTYDAAHRLVSVSDARGNSINYTLDNQGNLLVEQVKDPAGNLQRSILRSYDALNRVQQIKQ